MPTSLTTKNCNAPSSLKKNIERIVKFFESTLFMVGVTLATVMLISNIALTHAFNKSYKMGWTAGINLIIFKKIDTDLLQYESSLIKLSDVTHGDNMTADEDNPCTDIKSCSVIMNLYRHQLYSDFDAYISLDGKNQKVVKEFKVWDKGSQVNNTSVQLENEFMNWQEIFGKTILNS